MRFVVFVFLSKFNFQIDFVLFRNQIADLKKQNHELANGILYLKGGDLTEELAAFPKATEYNLSDFFKEEFFETKKVVHLPLKYKKQVN